MQWKADESAVNELANLAQEGIELPRTAEVSCEYLGVHTDDGFTLDARPTGRSTVGFKWSYRDRDNTAAFTQTKQARCDYAADQGPSLPEDWKTALKCRRIPHSHHDPKGPANNIMTVLYGGFSIEDRTFIIVGPY